MLSPHPLLTRRLRKHGQAAVATVTKAHRGHLAMTTGSLPSDQIANQRVHWTLELSVEPEGEPPFEARLDLMLGESVSVGDPFPVVFDPDDHSKIVFNDSDAGWGSATNRRIERRSKDRIARLRAEGNDAMADRFQALLDSGLETNWSTDRTELGAQIRERKAKIGEIMGAQPGAPTIILGRGGPAASNVDALAKLADLRDRGALTPEEFEAQKQRLLQG